jgi:hypothetical protein
MNSASTKKKKEEKRSRSLVPVERRGKTKHRLGFQKLRRTLVKPPKISHKAKKPLKIFLMDTQDFIAKNIDKN